MTETSTSFTYPEFWFYPPYFTIQPIKETQQKQKELWRDLILRYCRQHRIYTIENDESDDFPPFNNPAINRTSQTDLQLNTLPSQPLHILLIALQTFLQVVSIVKQEARCY